MTSIRQFQLNDLLIFNNVNLDVLTETYNGSFYMAYMSQWPESFLVAKSPSLANSNPYITTITSTTSTAATTVTCGGGSNDSSTTTGSTSENSSSTHSTSGTIMGYVIGKAEGTNKLWHGHVSAITVAPDYRRLGLAYTLMNTFETVCIDQYNAYFVDLFVRKSNNLAILMYNKFDYSIYRRVLHYYSGEQCEDAYDMRKSLPRDIVKESIIPLDHPVRPEDLEW